MQYTVQTSKFNAYFKFNTSKVNNYSKTKKKQIEKDTCSISRSKETISRSHKTSFLKFFLIFSKEEKQAKVNKKNKSYNDQCLSD